MEPLSAPTIGPRPRGPRPGKAAWGDRIFLGFGIEVGNAPEDFSAAEQVIAEPGLDLVIGSIHNSSAALQYQDYYYANFTSPAMCHQFLDDYFQSMLRLAQWGEFDTLGHIPYPLRYMRDRDGQDVSLAPYEGIIREILKAVIASGKAIELNTCKYHPGSAARLRGHPARLSRTGRGTGHRGRRRPLPRKRGTCLPGRT